MKNILTLTLLSSLLCVSTYAEMTKDSVKKVVSDDVSKLMWQDDERVKTVKKTWIDAINYCESTLNTENFAGYNDWRLPNINELASIIDYSKNTANSPSINTDVFENTASGGYWSSTTYTRDTKVSRNVRFQYGDTDYDNKTNSIYVRCVRGGQ